MKGSLKEKIKSLYNKFYNNHIIRNSIAIFLLAFIFFLGGFGLTNILSHNEEKEDTALVEEIDDSLTNSFEDDSIDKPHLHYFILLEYKYILKDSTDTAPQEFNVPNVDLWLDVTQHTYNDMEIGGVIASTNSSNAVAYLICKDKKITKHKKPKH